MSHSTKAIPLIRCTIVAASTQMNCIAIPSATEPGAMRRIAPPAVHCRCAATSSANPAAVNPILPVTDRTLAMVSVEASTTLRAAISDAAGADAASARAQTPDTAVKAPDTASRRGTMGVPNRSRTIQVLQRNHAPAINVSPEMRRAAPLTLYMALLAAIARIDSSRSGWSASAETRANTITTVAAAVSSRSRPALRAAGSRGRPAVVVTG